MMVSVNSRKGWISVNNTKYLLHFGILYLNAVVGWLSMRLKIKKEEKDQDKNNKSKKKKKKDCRQAGIQTTIACVESKAHIH